MTNIAVTNEDVGSSKGEPSRAYATDHFEVSCLLHRRLGSDHKMGYNIRQKLDQEQLRNNSVNGDGSQNSRSGTERPTRTPRECTFKDFLNCQPLTFKGTEGVVGLTQWFEKMESVFHISNCNVENQVKFATCTLLGATLTWWNPHVKTVGHDAAYGMS
ncbi:hypothetical protein Tco_0657774 [Tanacetum coccineum]